MTGVVVLILRVVSALALYGFIGWVLVFLYRDIQRQGTHLAQRRVPGLSIMVKPERDHATLRYFHQPEVTIGRDPGCDIPLVDDTISAKHALLSYHHNQWWLEDLASTNGTKLNDHPVTMPTVITSGDEIQCGGGKLTLSLSENIVIEPTVRRKINSQ